MIPEREMPHIRYSRDIEICLGLMDAVKFDYIFSGTIPNSGETRPAPVSEFLTPFKNTEQILRTRLDKLLPILLPLLPLLPVQASFDLGPYFMQQSKVGWVLWLHVVMQTGHIFVLEYVK